MINNYALGSRELELSKQIKDINYDNKIIYLAPCNAQTKVLYEFISSNFNPKKLLFIDNYKKEENIVTNKEIEEHNYIFLYSPNYHKEIAKGLPKHNLYYLYHDISNKFFITKYTKFNLLKLNLPNKLSFFNTYHTLKYFLANNHIYLTKNEKKLASFKNIHQGKRAFVIGNGPSLKIEDLNILKDEITFAANKIFLAFNETSWRPTYYSIEDSYDMDEYYEKARDLDCSIKFFPVKHLLSHPYISNAIYYPLIPNISKKYECSNNALKGIYPGCSVTYSMLQLALYMGITEIYLIGIDFSYIVPTKYQDSLVIHHDNEENHFHKDYRKKGDKWLEPNEDCQLEALKSAKKFVDLNDIKIYNASRKTKLELFNKVNFNTLF